MKSQTMLLGSFLVIAPIMLIHGADEKITLSQAPAKVQAAIKKYAKSNNIIRVEKANDGGQIQYEALTENADGKKIEFIVKSNGELDSTEERLSKDELPAGITKAVNSAVGGGNIHGIERITKDGTVTYEVGYETSKGDKQEAVISSEGKILENGADKD